MMHRTVKRIISQESPLPTHLKKGIIHVLQTSQHHRSRRMP